MSRECEICSKHFSGRPSSAKTCSEECSKALIAQRYREKYQLKAVLCQVCGEEFVPASRRRVCGESCKKLRATATRKRWEKANVEHSRQWRKDYYTNNKERIYKTHDKWRRNNLSKVNGYQRKRRYGTSKYKNTSRKHAIEAGFSSMFEMQFSEYLKKFSISYEYETEKFVWGKKPVLGECRDCGGENVATYRTYRPDFILEKLDGTKMYIELKGKFTPENRTKMREIKKTYPDIDLRIIFQQSKNKLTKGAKKTYAQWATNKNYPYICCNNGPAFLPDEWIKELKKS